MAAALAGGLTLAAGPALADHPGGLRDAPASPLVSALLFGGVALVLGLVVVAIVTVLTRRPDRGGPDGPEP